MSTGNSEFTADFFNESSRAWMLNKLRRGASMVYKCNATCKNGNACIRGSVIKDGQSSWRCAQHKQRVLEE